MGNIDNEARAVVLASHGKKPGKRGRIPTNLAQNGITKPSEETITGVVWDICDKISSELKEPADRARVMAATKARGINKGTAGTQYCLWRRFHGLVDRSYTRASLQELAARHNAEMIEADRLKLEILEDKLSKAKAREAEKVMLLHLEQRMIQAEKSIQELTGKSSAFL